MIRPAPRRLARWGSRRRQGRLSGRSTSKRGFVRPQRKEVDWARVGGTTARGGQARTCEMGTRNIYTRVRHVRQQKQACSCLACAVCGAAQRTGTPMPPWPRPTAHPHVVVADEADGQQPPAAAQLALGLGCADVGKECRRLGWQVANEGVLRRRAVLGAGRGAAVGVVQDLGRVRVCLWVCSGRAQGRVCKV